ncbi:MAG: tRNA epoxyqueuosine(34) reductase QueG [Planctomycetota bacterium]|nr:tRNA epoxyqueuosine(34) reductase QueG [Planctomycetota bacterium]
MAEDSVQTVDGESIVQRCLALGFACAGVCRAEPTRWAAQLRDWLASGKHGSMDYLAQNLALREDASRLTDPRARSVVMVADQYASRNAPGEHGGQARVARYAQGEDYHAVIKDRLHALADALRTEHPGHEFRTFVDTAPVLERELAARAGLGWTGKHTLLIHPERGSWLLLGGVATTLAIVPPREQLSVEDHCGTCTRCIDACPTGAITPYSVDASRCVSYLTIERRGEIAPEFHAGIGEWIFGCDVCQEVCPHNSPRPARATGAAHASYAPRVRGLDAIELLSWRPDDRSRVLSGSAMKRAKLEMLKRNALIVLGNTRPAGARARIEQIAADATEHELVRATARQVLERWPETT